MASLALAFDLIAKDKASKAFNDVGDASDKTGGKIGKLGPIAAGAATAIAGAAVAAGAALFKIGAAFDDASDTIRVGTGATGKALKGLENDFKAVVKTVPTDFGSASTAIADINTRLGLTGKPLQDVSKQFLELSRMTGTDLKSNIDSGTAALNGFGLSAEQQPGALDAIFRASQASGVSFGDLASQLASTGTTLRAVGFDFNESAALVATLGKAGLSTSDVMPGLSRAMATAAESGKSAGDVFKDTFDRIKNAPTEVDAAGVAMDVFGAKGGPKLAALIREGKLSLDDMLATVSTGSETIGKASTDTQDFGEKLTILKNNVLLALEPVAVRVFDAIGAAVDRVLPIMQALWEKHGPSVKAAMQSVSDFVSGTVVPILTQLAEYVRDNVLPVLADLARTVMGALREAFDTIRDKIEENKPQLEALFRGFKTVADFLITDVLPLLGPVLKLAFENVVRYISLGIDIVSALVNVFFTLKDTATSVIRVVVDTVLGFYEAILDGAGKVLSALGMDGLGEKLTNAAREVGVFRDSVNIALNGIKKEFDIKVVLRTEGMRDVAAAARNAARGDGPGRGGPTLSRVMPILNRLGGYVTSTYRTPAQNRAAGGSPTSYHMDAANPAVDIGGSTSLLDRLFPSIKAAGPWRELLWRVPGHYDHIHVAHNGGLVESSWPTMPGLRFDERPAILQIGERVQSRAELAAGTGPSVAYYGDFYSFDPRDVERERQKHMRDLAAVHGLTAVP